VGAALAALLGAASAATADRAPAPAPAVRPAPPGPTRCRDFPVSSAVVEPARCWRTGPQGWVVAGADPRHPRAGVLVVGRGQAMRVVRIRGGARRAAVAAGVVAAADLVGGRGTGAPAVARKVAAAGAATAAPLATASYYVYGTALLACSASPTAGCPLYVDGAAEPQSGGIVVLDFGAPCFVPHTSPLSFGTQLFGTVDCTPGAQLVPLVDAWLAGYATTHGARAPALRLAVGTSNSLTAADPPTGALTDAEMTAAGSAWATQVVGAVATGGLAAPVAVWGASDMEQSSSGNWYGPLPTEAWVRGFGRVTDPSGAAADCLAPSARGLLADFGDDVVGNGGWSAAAIYDVAYGLPAACALPEIYYRSMASEWAALNRWAAADPALAPRGPVLVTAVMDEPGTGLTPAAAWAALQAALGQRPRVAALTLIGSALASVTGVSGILPTTGAIRGGARVTITGSGLRGATAVHFGLRRASFRVISATTIRAVSPPQPAGGSVAVTVTTRAGTTGSAAAPQFLYLGDGPMHQLAPARVLDTRLGLGAPRGGLAPGGTLSLHLAGVDGIPRHALGAVFLNVTVVHPGGGGFLTVFPAGQPRPLAASVTFAAGRTTATLVAVVVGARGDVVVANGPGPTQVVADVLGWTAAAPVRASRPRPTPRPTPAATPTVVPTPVPTPTPTATPSAIPTPSGLPTGSPTPAAPTAAPAVTPPASAATPPPTAAPTPAATPTPIPAAGLYVPVTPARIADTRARATGPYAGRTLGPLGTITVQVAGRAGVPASGAAAVALNVTVTGPTRSGYLAVTPAGEARPTVSTLNFARGETVANRVVVGLGAGGAVTIANAAGRADVLVDVDGWFTAGTAPAPPGGQLHPMVPVRVLDTRPGSGQLDAGRPLGPAGLLPVALAGADGLPATSVKGVILHVTATGGTAASYLTAFPDGSPRPPTSDCNWTAGATAGTLVIVPVGPDGAVDLFNAAGTANLVVDLVGWYG